MKSDIFNSRFILGIEGLDKDYKNFFYQSRQLLDDVQQGEGKVSREDVDQIVSFLRNYFKDHFEKEENLQQELNYPYYPEHKRVHNNLYQRINTLINNLDNGQAEAADIYRNYNEIVSLFKAHIYYIDQSIKKLS